MAGTTVDTESMRADKETEEMNERSPDSGNNAQFTDARSYLTDPQSHSVSSALSRFSGRHSGSEQFGSLSGDLAIQETYALIEGPRAKARWSGFSKLIENYRKALLMMEAGPRTRITPGLYIQWSELNERTARKDFEDIRHSRRLPGEDEFDAEGIRIVRIEELLFYYVVCLLPEQLQPRAKHLLDEVTAISNRMLDAGKELLTPAVPREDLYRDLERVYRNIKEKEARIRELESQNKFLRAQMAT